ncbi:hypothetical protein TorRG33x02_132220 [Trema orientale]|uniref:Uncharacterized protein n=1 Tax=Trema orientale TaxID=63057 RepID=A0A2P5EZN3_TREOI|nr:hypothetical protein TorRG33x02_132220 [Trema orientale]
MAVVGLKGEHDLENGTTAQGQGKAPSLSMAQVSRGNAQVKNNDTSYKEVEVDNRDIYYRGEEEVADGDGEEEEEVVAGGNGVVGDSQKLAKEEEEKEKALTITITMQAGTECLAKMIISWESLQNV